VSSRSLSCPPDPLCALQPSSLWRRHQLRLVSTSKVCDLKLREPRASPADVAVLGDAMAGDPAMVAAVQREIEASATRGAASPAMQAVKRVAPLSPALASALLPDGDGVEVQGGSASIAVAAPGPSPVDRVAASLASAAAAASAAAQGAYSAAVPYAGGLGRTGGPSDQA
jgi:hypothetical protein